MRIVLESLRLRNFKGIRDFTATFEDGVNEVKGDNATGKTTLFDAFLWLLFDKDSQNRADFEIKTKDKDGEAIHGLNHEVEARLLIDGKPMVLKKVYSEKWTKKRGSATEEFTGHTTDYFIDGVPMKQKEYKDAVDGLVKEGVFKLLTNPTYFNEQLDWKQRRKILIEVCGDITDDEVINSNSALAALPDILNGRSIEDHRKVIAARRAEINKELEKIPVRIDEVTRNMPDISGLDEVLLDSEIHGLRVAIDEKSAELVRIQNGVQIAELEKRLRQIDSEVIDIKNRARNAAMSTVDSQAKKVHILQSNLYRLQDDVARAKVQIERTSTIITEKKEEAEKLRAKWAEVNAEQLDLHVDENCPACGQALPDEQIASARDTALANFNRQKAQRLEEITTKGKGIMAEVALLEAENAKLQTYVDEHTSAIESAVAELENAKAELERLQSITVPEDIPELNAKLDEYERVSGELMALRESTQETVANIQSGIAALRQQLQQKEQDKAKFAQVESAHKRIEELKKQERALAAEFESLEEQLYLTEEFIRTKVQLLEDRINSKFKLAQFRMFEQQINGGLAETCETLFDGVSYSGGLNNAGRIQVGLDIINTLSEHYGLYAPVFIDNAEAVTHLPEMNSQMIAMYVDENHKTLHIESSNLVKEAV
ncbi:MAG: AAA family ATPase [Alicyclobacillus sp.]|nr:AAA family ATPase [Alicyclobacillus sp.]